MRGSFARRFGLTAVVALLLGCSSDSDLNDPGTETGPCNDSQCFPGLVCLSDLCVDAASGGSTSAGTSTAGMTSAGSGGGSGQTTANPMRSGQFLLAVDTVIAPGLPLQFLATVDDSGDAVSVDLQLLSLDQGSTTSPRLVLDPVVTVGPADYAADGSFTLSLAMLDVPGEANPITGSALTTAPLDLAGSFTSNDSFCGQANGMVVMPIMASLDGSTFAAVRVTGPSDLPLDFPVSCE